MSKCKYTSMIANVLLIQSRIHKVIDGLLCSNQPAKKMSKWHMVWVSAYLTNYAILCSNVTCFGKLWCRPFQWYINHFIPISSSWDMNQSFNISKSFGHFFWLTVRKTLNQNRYWIQSLHRYLSPDSTIEIRLYKSKHTLKWTISAWYF